jgi:phosphoglycerate dehydrogenase-like enzyme
VDARPTVILHPASQSSERIFTPEAWVRLNESFRVVDLEHEPSDAALDAALPDAFAVVGQPDLPRDRLLRAPHLRALLNVEGNFLPNVDYRTCFEKGMHVLNCGPAYAQAVAEYALGLALDLARGISREDRAFRESREQYFGRSAADSILLRHAEVGLLGYGSVGRALHRLLVPFAPTLRVYDPWLPAALLREADVVPASLEATLASQFVFVAATITDTNRHLLDANRLDLLPAGARLVLVSRAAIVDYEAMLDRVGAGRFLAAVDVWPQEPAPRDHRARAMEGLVLSAHRAGGIAAALNQIGDMVVDDLTLIAAGLPPARMQAGARELVDRYRNQARQ